MRKVLAASVHVLTASGAPLGFAALLAADRGRWEAAFLWLGLALVADGLDGPLARRIDAARVLPRFSGRDLDLIVDYLNYVTVPAFIVARSAVVPHTLAVPLAMGIMLVSLYHFADADSKTGEGYFVGFPAIWNLVALYGFVLDVPQVWMAVLIGICAVLTFVPLRWLHPFRVRRLRPATLIVVAVWSCAAVFACLQGFPGALAVRLVFTATALYVTALGIFGSANIRIGYMR